MKELKSTILVVEDETNIRETIQDILELVGYNVVTANDGESGFFKVIKHSPDLIISDLMMPKMDGFELLEAVRSYSKSRFTPFIILSAKSESIEIRSGLRMGADDYLLKPFDQKELLDSVEYRLGHKNELIKSVKDSEVKRMRMDIHDNAQQTIVSLKMNVERLLLSDPGDLDLKKEFSHIKRGLDVAFIQIRNLIDGNAAQNLLTQGFRKTIDKMVKNFDLFTDINISFIYQFEKDPSFEKSVELVSIISELLTNSLKHADATTIEMRFMQLQAGRLQIVIMDDGNGFDKEAVLASGGFKNLLLRMPKIDGTIEIESTPGVGTCHTIQF